MKTNLINITLLGFIGLLLVTASINPKSSMSIESVYPSPASMEETYHVKSTPTPMLLACLPTPTATPTPTSGTNPSLSAVGEVLSSTAAKAIAWQESHWKQFDTSGQPLIGSSGDTGMMQVVPASGWENWFSVSGRTPPGYTVCSWSDMKWNWQTNVHNGKYILETYLPAKMTSTQKNWQATSSSSSTPNREDLAIYGYNKGEGKMGEVTAANWVDKVANDPYVQSVRALIHSTTPPWGNN